MTETTAPATDHDVIIIGFGPVGSTLAGLLAQRGLRVLAVDRDTAIHPLPRAVHFDQEIMRVLQELGCADAVGARTIANPGMDFVTADRQVLLSVHGGDLTPSGWPASLFFHQPDLELVLRDVARAAGTEIRLGVAADDVRDDGRRVEVSFSDGSVATADYVVACDGARSGVRKQLGIAMHDLGFEEPWLVTDLVLHADAGRPSERTLQVCDPRRPTTLVPMPAPRFRFEFMLLPGDDPAALAEPASVRALLADWMNPDHAEVERSAVYTFHGLIATEWRRGRVLLAGDAAHQTPPFLGQGMCSGIRDAQNLAWKLARVVHGMSPAALLDTYQAEREPQVQHIIQLAVDFGRLICTTDTAVAAERDAAMLAARAAGGGSTENAPMPPLPAGPLVGPGVQARQPMLGHTRFDDLVGDRFAVVVRHPDMLASDGGTYWAERGAALFDTDGTPALTTVLDAFGADVVVIRPDRYVLSAGPTLTAPGTATQALLTA